MKTVPIFELTLQMLHGFILTVCIQIELEMCGHMDVTKRILQLYNCIERVRQTHYFQLH